MQFIDTMSLRNKASRFGAASVELKNSADRLAETDTSLTEGGDAWKGQGALGFLVRSQKHREDITLASKAFYQAAQALISLAGQFEQVNQLRREAEQMRFQIEDLHSELRYTDDPARQSSIRDSIHSLSARKRNTENYADQLESRADQNASSQFNEIADMCDRLRTPDSYDNKTDLSAPFVGTSKMIANSGTAVDLLSTWNKSRKGFGVHYSRDKSGAFYARVQNGHLDGIAGKKYSVGNASNTPQVFKYINGNAAARYAVTDFKSIPARLGYIGTFWETGSHFKENIEDGKGWSYTTSEVVVDIGLGVAGMAATAWATAQMGAVYGSFGGPVGVAVGVTIGAVVGVSIAWLTDGQDINGKPINEHLKETLSHGLEGVGNMCVSGLGAISSFFTDDEEDED